MTEFRATTHGSADACVRPVMSARVRPGREGIPPAPGRGTIRAGLAFMALAYGVFFIAGALT